MPNSRAATAPEDFYSSSDSEVHERELKRHLSIRLKQRRVRSLPTSSSWSLREIVSEVLDCSHGLPHLQQWFIDSAFPSKRDSMDSTAWSSEVALELRVYSRVSLLVDVLLRSIGQVFICDNPISGVLMLIGVGLSGPQYVLYSLMGALFGNLGALIALRQLTPDFYLGLFGYDAVLYANAMCTFLDNPLSAAVLFFTLFGCTFVGLARTSVGTVMSQCKLPTATITFCSMTVCSLYVVSVAHPMGLQFAVPAPAPVDLPSTTFGSIMAWSVIGIGQVIFASTLPGAILVLLGIAVYSRLGAVGALVGAIIGTIMGLYVVPDITNTVAISQGLFSYNGGLTCMALSIGVFIKLHSLFDLIVPVIGAVSATLGQIVARNILPAAVPVCTFPFVFTMYLVLPALVHRLVAEEKVFSLSDAEDGSDELAPSGVRRAPSATAGNSNSSQQPNGGGLSSSNVSSSRRLTAAKLAMSSNPLATFANGAGVTSSGSFGPLRQRSMSVASAVAISPREGGFGSVPSKLQDTPRGGNTAEVSGPIRVLSTDAVSVESEELSS